MSSSVLLQCSYLGVCHQTQRPCNCTIRDNPKHQANPFLTQPIPLPTVAPYQPSHATPHHHPASLTTPLVATHPFLYLNNSTSPNPNATAQDPPSTLRHCIMRSVVEIASLKSPDRGNGTLGLCDQKSDMCKYARDDMAAFATARTIGVVAEVVAGWALRARRLSERAEMSETPSWVRKG